MWSFSKRTCLHKGGIYLPWLKWFQCIPVLILNDILLINELLFFFYFKLKQLLLSCYLKAVSFSSISLLLQCGNKVCGIF